MRHRSPHRNHAYHNRSRSRSGRSQEYNIADRNMDFPQDYDHGNPALPFSVNPGTSWPHLYLLPTNTSLPGNHSYSHHHINYSRQEGIRSRSRFQENYRPQTNMSNYYGPQENSLMCNLQENQRHMRILGNHRYQENPPDVRPQNYSSHNYYTRQHTGHGSRAHSSHNNARLPHTWQQEQQPRDITKIKMTKLPFFEVVATPLQVLIRSYGPDWINFSTFVIEKSLLQFFRDKNTTNPYQVQIRICKYASCEQKDYFSPDLQVKVNGQLCILPGWNTIPKGPPAPIEITSKCDFQRNHNTIDVRTRDCLVMFVHVVRRLTHEVLLKKLLAKSPIDPSATVARIKEKLQQDSVNGADITLTSLHFSLMCPVSKARMKLPCRASSCQHLQCFDAGCYLKMNEKKPKWICPVCSNVIEYENLQIDQHFKNILEQNISSEKILLQVDGSCKPFLPKDVDEGILTLDDTLDHFTADDMEPHPSDNKEPHPSDNKESHPSHDRESHPSHDRESHPSHDKEFHPSHDKEFHPSHDKEFHPSHDKESHPSHDKESHPSGIEEPHHITIDLLSEDDFPVSSSEDDLPVVTDTDCASSKDTQNHTVAEIVILSDDETYRSPAHRALVSLPSPSCWVLSGSEASSTPTSRPRRKRKYKSKKTPKTATNTTSRTGSEASSTPKSCPCRKQKYKLKKMKTPKTANTTTTTTTSSRTDRRGTRMVLRSHLQGKVKTIVKKFE